jgi:undecaprenyl-diphosphatase
MAHLFGAVVAVLAFAAMAVLVQSGRTTMVDDAILRWVARLRGPLANKVAETITWLGSGLVLIPLGFAITALLWRHRKPHVAKLYFATCLVGWAGYGILKAAFARPRPDLIPRLSEAGWWSFPSGHSMSSTIVLGLGAIMLTHSALVRIATALVVLAIVFSRVYLGVHYPSDVLAGVFAGSACISAALAIEIVDPVVHAEAATAAPLDPK